MRNIKKKNMSYKNVKRFSLKATASVVLTLNAEAVMATDCTASITGTTLAGIICDFNSNTGSSVTVVNDGTAGGINMASYTPSSSFITVNAGGALSNATGITIAISQSSLSHGISNQGTVSNTAGVGLSIHQSSTISGGIVNGGVIHAGGLGISIDHSIINHGIENSGALISVASSALKILGTSTIHGGISNSGTMIAGGVDNCISIIQNSIINGNIDTSGLLEIDNGNAIFVRESSVEGGISNSGTIKGMGPGIVLANTSTVQNDVFNSGTIHMDQHALIVRSSASIGGNVVNKGTLKSGQQSGLLMSTAIINGHILNEGIISGGQSGISLAYTTVNSGVINSGTIQGNSQAISIDVNSYVDHIDIIGQHARIIGAVTAHAANTTAVNIKNGATFTTEGSFDVDVFNIEANALLNMENSISATMVNNSGTLAITDPIRTITGSYTQQTGGLFQTEVASASDYGQLSVTGDVDLSASGDIDVQVTQNVSLHNGEVLPNIIRGNTLIIPSSGLSVSDNSYIWSFTPALNNTGNGVNLIAAINPEAYNVCQGTYCQSAAEAIIGQVAMGNPLFSPYATLATANALREAASQATPELTNENVQAIRLATGAVLDIVPMRDTLHGESSGDAMLYQPGKIWIKPYGASMMQKEHSTVQGFQATVYGAVIGKDVQLSNDWLFGGGLAAGGDDMHGRSVLNGQLLHSQTYQGLLYGAKQFPNHVYFAGQGLVGYGANHTSRAIPLYASIAKGAYDSWFTNIRAEAGWRSYALSPNFIFTPEVDASYLFVSQGRYQESGSPMDLLVASNHNASLVLGAYGNGAYHLATMNNYYHLTLTGYAGLAGNVMNNQPQVSSTFVASSSSTFSTYGVQFNGAVFRGGAGLDLTNPTNPLIVELNYDLQVGNNAYSSVGAATIKYKA